MRKFGKGVVGSVVVTGLFVGTLVLGCGSEGSAPASGSAHTATTAAATSTATATMTATATASATATATATAATTAGAAAGDPGCPEGMVKAPPGGKLCMTKTEVTVDDYRKCVDDKKCNYKKPVNPGCNWLDPAKGKHPMNCVPRSGAEAYCQAHGGRLPSVDEWELASRDADTSRKFPWGAEDPMQASEDKYWCWSGKTKRDGTCEVGSFPGGATKAGLLDMSGNVSEWATGADVDEKSKTCGRSYEANEAWKAQEKCPGGYLSEAQVPTIGFRCVALATN